MKIIAIDPGYDRVGVAIIEKIGTERELLHFSTCITTDRKSGFYERLEYIQKELEQIIIQHNPEILVMEELYFAKNTTTALKVAEARGIISGTAISKNITVEEIHPNHVKIAITGHGAAKKEDILFMLPKLITIDTKNKLDDELDAVAIGIAFLAHYKISLLQK
jgi:crossover junction endodeoxyribonuclease RuvC